jgi:CubicO group peptidase (beta-lactamase class C family)
VAPGDSLADVVPRFASLPLRFQPGSAFRYSPEIGFDALGRIIEVVSGESLDAFVRARLLEPIGARDLWFHVPADRLGDVATLYARTPDGLRPVAPHGAHALTTVPDSRYCSASGGMAGTAESYARFALMLAGRGQLDGRRVLAPRSVALMASNHIGRLPAQSIVLDLRGYRIGLGVRVLEDPAEAGSLASPGTFGWSGLYGTYLWIDPVEELVGILLVQRALDLQDQALGRLAPRVENAIFQALE